MMEQEFIEVVGASENNLRHIDVNIPKGKLVVMAGVSGSGKSSLAFDTLAVESSRKWQASYPLYLRNRMPRYDRPAVDYIRNLTPAVVVDQKPIGANSRSTVGTVTDVAPLIRLLFSRVGQPSAGGATAYSFNHPLGMCPDCTGLGERARLAEELLFDREKSIREGGIRFTPFAGGSWQGWLYRECPLYDSNKKLKDFTSQEWKDLCYGPEKPLEMTMVNNQVGTVSNLKYEGVIPRFNRLYLNRDLSRQKKAVQEEVMRFIRKGPCPSCGGTGLNPKALASRINGFNIADYYDMQVTDLLPVLRQIQSPVGASIARQVADCLENMIAVGLGYLSLSRRTDTLSGGEAQRLKMVRSLGSSLNDITYIFDEPTAGLHPEDARRIGRLLTEMRDRHNTVLVVEHNRDLIQLADQVIELGPLAGVEGGQIVFQGSVAELAGAETLTAKALRETIPVNRAPRPWKDAFSIQHAALHNLKDVSVDIPKGVLTAVSGMAGSGKSSLIRYAFAEGFPEVIVIDQKPIGVSSRSTPATYTGAMDEIRKLFAKANKVGPEWFSFNSKGACPVCKGKGEIAPDVAFADPVAVLCEECGGRRYNPRALRYTYRSRNIEQVMALTIREAVDFFRETKVHDLLQGLLEVGLGYMTLGQPTSTLSGGETQRLKLASRLHEQGNVYVLDEPSVGMHCQDIRNLLDILQRLVDQGNTVVMVEHRLELIAAADWVIDMGPEGGNHGGKVIFTGTPEQLLHCEYSATAAHLRRFAAL